MPWSRKCLQRQTRLDRGGARFSWICPSRGGQLCCVRVTKLRPSFAVVPGRPVCDRDLMGNVRRDNAVATIVIFPVRSLGRAIRVLSLRHGNRRNGTRSSLTRRSCPSARSTESGPRSACPRARGSGPGDDQTRNASALTHGLLLLFPPGAKEYGMITSTHQPGPRSSRRPSQRVRAARRLPPRALQRQMLRVRSRAR